MQPALPMAQEWVITTFGTLVDGLKAATTSPDTSPIPHQLGWSEAWVPEPGRRLFLHYRRIANHKKSGVGMSERLTSQTLYNGFNETGPYKRPARDRRDA
jgi:hypothetical protein